MCTTCDKRVRSRTCGCAQGPWRASLWKGANGQKRTVHLGTFRCAMTAALAYDRAVYTLRGRVAKTNFPVSEELLAACRIRAPHDVQVCRV